MLELYKMMGYYSAADIAKEAGVRPPFVGRIANIFNLKTEEYGVPLQYNNNFAYNEKGREKLLNLIEIINTYEENRKYKK